MSREGEGTDAFAFPGGSLAGVRSEGKIAVAMIPGRRPTVGMAPGMDFLQVFDAHFGIDGGCVQPGMPEQLLDDPNVGAAFQHPGGTSVSEQMAAAAHMDTGCIQQLAHQIA